MFKNIEVKEEYKKKLMESLLVDAIAEKNVKIIGSFNTNLHKPIHYWAAAVENFYTNTTINFLDFLTNDYSKNVYSKHGFKQIENY